MKSGVSGARRERLDEIMWLLRQNDGHLKFSQLHGILGYRYGTTETALWDYVSALKAAGRVDYQEVNPIIGNDIDIELVEEILEGQFVSEWIRLKIMRALRREVWLKEDARRERTGA